MGTSISQICLKCTSLHFDTFSIPETLLCNVSTNNTIQPDQAVYYHEITIIHVRSRARTMSDLFEIMGDL
jgi:hypothetical protein